MKKTLFCILACVLGVLTVGCGAEKMATADQSIQQVSVASSNGFGGGSQDFIWTSESQEEIDSFERLIANAEKKNVDVDQPTYDATINYGKGEKGGERIIHLIEMDNGQYALMYAGHENETYVANEKISQQVEKLLE